MVPDRAIKAAILLLLEHTHNLAERGGAIPLAAALSTQGEIGRQEGRPRHERRQPGAKRAATNTFDVTSLAIYTNRQYADEADRQAMARLFCTSRLPGRLASFPIHMTCTRSSLNCPTDIRSRSGRMTSGRLSALPSSIWSTTTFTSRSHQVPRTVGSQPRQLTGRLVASGTLRAVWTLI